MAPSPAPALAALLCVALAGCADDGSGYDPGVTPADFGDGVLHPYLPLEEGAVWVYEAETEDGTKVTTVEVLEERRKVHGVMATVVRDTVTLDGEVVGETHRWYAQDHDGTVWLLGEDHVARDGGEGSWAWGVGGALPGIAMRSDPRPDSEAYRMGYHPGVAEDRAAVIDAGRSIEVPFGTFDDTLTTRQWSDLEPDGGESVHHARGIGIVLREPEDGGPAEVLVSYTSG